jgi:hypothetical protein
LIRNGDLNHPSRHLKTNYYRRKVIESQRRIEYDAASPVNVWPRSEIPQNQSLKIGGPQAMIILHDSNGADLSHIQAIADMMDAFG